MSPQAGYWQGRRKSHSTARSAQALTTVRLGGSFSITLTRGACRIAGTEHDSRKDPGAAAAAVVFEYELSGDHIST